MKITVCFRKQNQSITVSPELTAEKFLRLFLDDMNILDYTNYELYSIALGKVLEGSFVELGIQDFHEVIIQVKATDVGSPKNADELIPEIELSDLEESRVCALESLPLNIDKTYKHIALNAVFDDTLVTNCWFHERVFQEILGFSQFSVNAEHKFEYGGFLLGRFLEEATGEFTVLVEDFVQPSEYAFHNEYRIDFGSKAMIELDAALQKNSDFCLIGWFHTHPGHTVFLSQYDLNAHYGSFIESYQIAVVCDTLTAKFETAVFSRRKNMKMNNRSEIKESYYLLDLESLD